MKKHHDISNLHFSGDYMILTVDGAELSLMTREVSSLLAQASDKEKEEYEISPSGYGIHWPLIDEDIAVDGLLGIVHTRDARRKTA